MQSQFQCSRCKHYYITWDKNFPYGCKAMQFKGRQIPCVAVKQASGKPCFSFEEKQVKNKE